MREAPLNRAQIIRTQRACSFVPNRDSVHRLVKRIKTLRVSISKMIYPLPELAMNASSRAVLVINENTNVYLRRGGILKI